MVVVATFVQLKSCFAGFKIGCNQNASICKLCENSVDSG